MDMAFPILILGAVGGAVSLFGLWQARRSHERIEQLRQLEVKLRAREATQ